MASSFVKGVALIALDDIFMFVLRMLSGKGTRQQSKYSHAEGSESEYYQCYVCFDNDIFNIHV